MPKLIKKVSLLLETLDVPINKLVFPIGSLSRKFEDITVNPVIKQSVKQIEIANITHK